MKKNFYVIGSPVSHSLSPLIHHTLYRHYEMDDCTYTYQDLTPENLPAFMEKIKTDATCGLNVTTPLKKKIISYMDTIDPQAHGGLNTVVVDRERRLHGFSTDAAGFFHSLTDIGGGYENKNIVIMGYGAVAEALLHDMLKKHAKKITVANRTLSKILPLNHLDGVSADCIKNVGAHMRHCDILINTTPVGMPHVNAAHDYTFLSELPRQAYVCDLIYNPPETPLLRAARQNGNPTLNGLGMLIWQAFYAFEKFFRILPGQKEYAAVLHAIKNRQS